MNLLKAIQQKFQKKILQPAAEAKLLRIDTKIPVVELDYTHQYWGHSLGLNSETPTEIFIDGVKYPTKIFNFSIFSEMTPSVGKDILSVMASGKVGKLRIISCKNIRRDLYTIEVVPYAYSKRK